MLSFWFSAHVLAQPCDTMQRLFDAPSFPTRDVVTIFAEEKLIRDVYSGPIDGLRSDNFVLKWGSDYGGSPFGDIVLNGFETLWEVEIIEWEHAFPYGTDTHLFNIYIGNTGPEVPSIPNNVAAYYTRDVEGWPMIVINPTTLGGAPSEVFALLAHEFYHAVQDAEEAFDTPLSRWLWEPTANWASMQFVPDSPFHFVGMDSYLALSEKSLRFFQSVEELSAEEYYTYGEVLFPIHMHERVGEPLLIPEIWKRGTSDSDAISIIAEVLGEYNLSFIDVWMDHNEGAISLNYEQGALYREIVGDDWYTETISQTGVVIHEADEEQALENYGFHAHRMYAPSLPLLQVQVWADPIGSYSSIGQFAARVVHKTPNETFSYSFSMDNYFDEIRLEVSEEDEIYLVVGAWTDEPHSEYDEGETFTYSFSMEGKEYPPNYIPVDDDTGLDLDVDVWGLICGCGHIDPLSASAGLWALLLYWNRRRHGDVRNTT